MSAGYLTAYNTSVGVSHEERLRSSQIKRLDELMDPTPWNVSDFKLDFDENEPTWLVQQRNPVSTFYWTNQLWERLQNPHKDPNTAIKTSSTDVYVLGEYSIHTFYIDNALGQGVGARCRELFLGDIPECGAAGKTKKWTDFFNHSLHRVANDPSAENNDKRTTLAQEIFNIYLTNDVKAKEWYSSYPSAKKWVKTYDIVVKDVESQAIFCQEKKDEQPKRKHVGGRGGQGRATDGRGRGRQKTGRGKRPLDGEDSNSEEDADEELEAKFNRLSTQFDNLKIDRDKLKGKLDDATASLQGKSEQVEQLTASIVQKDKALDEYRERAKKAEDKNDKKEDERDQVASTLQSQVSDLQTKASLFGFIISGISNMYAPPLDGGIEDDDVKKKIAPFFRMALRSAIIQAHSTYKWDRGTIKKFFSPFTFPWTDTMIDDQFPSDQ